MTNQPPITEVLLSRSELLFGIDQNAQARASVISIGNEAAGIVHKGQTGRVLAVFDRSFYVQCDQDVFCIGVASLGQGPLHVLLASERDNLPLNVSNGASVYLRHDSSPVEEKHAALYAGKVSVNTLNTVSQQTVQKALKLVSPPTDDGFGWTLGRTDWQHQSAFAKPTDTRIAAIDSSLRKQCLPAMQCLNQWLVNAIGQPVQALDGVKAHASMSPVLALLGAGPGLTPSGDDLLAGVMVSLRRCCREDLAVTLWQLLKPHLKQRTNVISGAHLRMAARGQCSEPVLSLLECVFSDSGCEQIDNVQGVATKIQTLANRIGASSGCDTLAGMSLVLLAL